MFAVQWSNSQMFALFVSTLSLGECNQNGWNSLCSQLLQWIGFDAGENEFGIKGMHWQQHMKQQEESLVFLISCSYRVKIKYRSAHQTKRSVSLLGIVLHSKPNSTYGLQLRLTPVSRLFWERE